MPPSPANPKQATNLIFVQVAALYGVVCAVVIAISSLAGGSLFLFTASSIVAWAIIGWCQFALFNALHEGLHQRFGSPHREAACYALTAYPVGFDETYRKVHLNHHKYFGDRLRDPDYPNYGNFPGSKRAFITRLFLNLCGWFALMQFFGIRQASRDHPEHAPDRRSLSPKLKVAVTQLVIFSLFTITVGWFYYFWLWLIPLATFGKLFSSTRTFCEHGNPDDAPVIRSITGPYFEEKLMGIFCFNYHAEHHHSVGIPYHRLKAAHDSMSTELYMASTASGPRYEHFDRGYLHLLFGWFSALPL